MSDTSPRATWTKLIGPVYAADEVANWLQSSDEELASSAARGELVALRTADDMIVFPEFQFDRTGAPLPRLAAVVEVLRQRLDEWGIAIWLAQPSRTLKASPAELLRSSDESDFERVIELALTALGEPK